MNTNVLRKNLVVAVILLFIGVSIAPSINFTVVKASNDNDLVEVTTQACGINGFGNTTMKLTREQYQNLEQYLVEFRERLNQTTTREEAVPLFKEAVVELEKYGLLPKGMNVEKAQRLMTGGQNTVLSHLFEKTSFVNRINDSNNSNYLCLVCSVTDGLITAGPIYRMINNIMYPFFELNSSGKILNFLYEHGYIFLYKILGSIIIVILELLYGPWLFGSFITTLNPFKVLYTLTYGGEGFNSQTNHYEYHSSNGWVATFGLNGTRIFQNQPLWGHLPQYPIPIFVGSMYYFYPGIFDFTGIRIVLTDKAVHLGFALWVEIGSEYPELPH